MMNPSLVDVDFRRFAAPGRMSVDPGSGALLFPPNPSADKIQNLESQVKDLAEQVQALAAALEKRA